MKLAPIAIGIGSAVTILGKMLNIATASSAHFAATQKLWDTSIKMIFRPMGDTIGLILRPFALMMLRWALPFYQNFAQNIDEITAGGESLAEGKIFEATGQVGGGIVDTLFGEGAGKVLREFGQAYQELTDALVKGFAGFSNWEIMPQAMADTGEEFGKAQVAITGLKNELSLFEQVIGKVQNVIKEKSLTGLGADFGEGSGITASGRGGRGGGMFGTSGKTMSSATFMKLSNKMGLDKAMDFVAQRGISLQEMGTGAGSRGTNPRAGSQGITVNFNNAIMSDPDLGRKIQEEIQREIKKLPGRR